MERRADASGVPTVTSHWSDSAACKGQNPNIFFPNSGPNSALQAKAICAGCVVRSACLQDALATDDCYGIRGGTTPVERQRINDGATLRRLWCNYCARPFELVVRGRAPRYCSEEHLRLARLEQKSRSHQRRVNA